MRGSFVLLMVCMLLPTRSIAQDWAERSDWGTLFEDANVTGTIVVIDERHRLSLVYNPDRARQRFIPASTFKLPHLLFALDAGIAKDEFQTFHWDGVSRRFPHWNRDQTLRSSISGSVVWVYQDFARRLGEKKEQRYLRKIRYGNRNVSGGIDRFWLDGGLRISAIEQIDVLMMLYRNAFPFKVEHQRLVKDMMLIDAGRNHILRGKTGWAFDVEPQIGWFIGWVERPEGAVFFAMNMEMPNGAKDAPKREAIVRAALRSIDAIPASPL
jgi:beta-lactamase class D